MNPKKGLIAIGAAHFAEVVGFYENLFARKPIHSIGEYYVEFEVAGLHLGIFKPSKANIAQFENSPEGHGLSLCFQVENLDEFIKECRLKGLSIQEPIITKHGRETFLFDPEKNRLIFSEMTKDE